MLGAILLECIDILDLQENEKSFKDIRYQYCFYIFNAIMASDPEYIAELVYPEEYHWYSGTLTYSSTMVTDMKEDNTKIKALPLQNQKYDVFRAT